MLKNKSYSTIVLLIFFMVMFYITIIYPQKKKNQKHQLMINSLNVNDKILINGIIGTVIEIIDKNYIKVLLNTNCKILVKKKYITKILNKKNNSYS